MSLKQLTTSLFSLLAFFGTGLSQQSLVETHTFDMGFGITSSAGTTIAAAVGQVVAGRSEGASHIEFGFASLPALRSSFLPPELILDSAVVGQAVGVTITLPPGTQTFAESLYYRRGGEPGFIARSLLRSRDTLQGAIPLEYVTKRGIEFVVRFLEGSGGLVVLPLNGLGIIRVPVQQDTSAVTLSRRKYAMVSVPFDLASPEPLSVFSNDFGPYNRSRWRLFRWENNANREYPNIAATVRPGAAFWLISHAGGAVHVKNARSVTTGVPYSIVLQPGWNQIASPFAFPVHWGSAGRINSVSLAYSYDGTEYTPGVTTLKPWEGYFVKNDSTIPVTAFIAPVEASIGTRTTGIASEKEYALQIAATVPGTDMRDTYNYIGFTASATDGKDDGDFPEPPPIGDGIQLSIMECNERFMTSFRAFPAEGDVWDVQLRSAIDNQQAVVTLTETSRRPDGFHLFVLDRDNLNSIPIVDQTFGVQLERKESVRSLRIIIGTEQFAETHSDGIHLVPLTFALEQNFPNPFNPTTTIRYQLEKRTDVTLEIYNLLGQRVRSLVHAEQITGTYAVQWDGRSDAGTSVASGMYVYRLHAGNFVASKKLLFLK